MRNKISSRIQLPRELMKWTVDRPIVMTTENLVFGEVICFLR